jgi:hypothetical protein
MADALRRSRVESLRAPRLRDLARPREVPARGMDDVWKFEGTRTRLARHPHSSLVVLAPAHPPDPNPAPLNLPVATTAPAQRNLAGGLDEVLGSLLPSDYQDALDALVNVEVNIVVAPDRQDPTVQGFLLDHCEGAPPKVGDRFAILDSQRGAPITGTGRVADQIAPLTGNGLGFATIYYPWVLVRPHPRRRAARPRPWHRPMFSFRHRGTSRASMPGSTTRAASTRHPPASRPASTARSTSSQCSATTSRASSISRPTAST